ncbi:MAG: pentapeptide repeat-containing protein [Helicobacter sp.]|nr:pentapeptide repeat-containing protein [Helicobacter sp.]
MEYDEQLKEYGILATNTENKIEDNKIIIEFAQIDKIDLKRLQEKKIKEIRIYGSEIQYIYFNKDTTIDIDFEYCNFKNQVIDRGHNFNNTIAFTQCIFEAIVDFSKATFNCQTTFLNSIFKAEAFFDHAEFQGGVSFEMSRFKAETSFINTKFSAKQGNNKTAKNNFQDTIFEGYTFFHHAEFKGRVNFEFSRFKDEVLFVAINLDKCIFDHIEFNKTKFISINSKNAETCTFRNSTFKDTLSFENTNISKLEFDNVVFNGIITFNEANSNKPSFTNCTFSNQFNIEHEYIQYSYEKIEKIIEEKIERIEKYKSSLNYRDLFRKLKSNRIAHHNLIDASELHSQELYARELELKHKGNKTIKEHIEKWQLWFYYKLCDHHTDILKSFHSLMLVIGLFGLMGFGVIAGFDYCLGYKPILSHLYMIKEIYDAHIHFFIKTHTLYTFLFNISILGAYLLMLFISIKWKIPRVFLIGVSYVIVICILLVSPKILIPAMGIFTDKRALLDPLSTLGGIYTICFGFVLFSFIKTIRKNSIVPN